MALTLLQARREITDMPRPCAAPGQYEQLTVQADGVATRFRLRFANANLASLALYTVTSTPSSAGVTVQTLVLPTDPTLGYTTSIDANGIPWLIFNTAPARGTALSVLYLVTAFSDADISFYLNASTRSTDLLTLKAFHYEMIPVILGNQEAMTIYTLTDEKKDPTAFINAQLKLRDSLAEQLEQEPGDVPAVGVMSMHDFGPYGWGGW